MVFDRKVERFLGDGPLDQERVHALAGQQVECGTERPSLMAKLALNTKSLGVQRLSESERTSAVAQAGRQGCC
jgi:hypothetical protein